MLVLLLPNLIFIEVKIILMQLLLFFLYFPVDSFLLFWVFFKNPLIAYTPFAFNSYQTIFFLFHYLNLLPLPLPIHPVVLPLLWIIKQLKIFQFSGSTCERTSIPTHIFHYLVANRVFSSDLNFWFWHGLNSEVLSCNKVSHVFIIHHVKNCSFFGWVKSLRLKSVFFLIVIWFFSVSSCECSVEHSFSFLIQCIIMLISFLHSSIMDFIIFNLERSSNHY